MMSHDDDRSVSISIGGQEYRLVLSTLATKEIGKRYGGMENLSDKLMNAENFEAALDEVVWLITIMANQDIMKHNFLCPNEKRPLLSTEAVELLTSPSELADFRPYIMEAMYRGTRRNIESEPDEKNAAAE